MNREPIGLYLLRIFAVLGLFVFMAMVYWSSSLLEQDIKAMRADLRGLRNTVLELRSEVQVSGKETQDLLQGSQEKHQRLLKSLYRSGGDPASLSDFEAEMSAMTTTQPISRDALRNRVHVDPSRKNLLQDDPFYVKTLPKLLGAGFRPRGVRLEATVVRPEHLHPFTNWSDVSAWQAMCSVSLAGGEFGKYETFAPELAVKIEERPVADSDRSEYWVHLRDGVYWQPLDPDDFPDSVQLSPHFLKHHQVTAHDVKFYFDAMMNPFVHEPGAVALRNYLGDIEEIRVVDDLTMVVRWKTEDVKQADGSTKELVKYIARQWTGALRPLPRWVFQYFADGSKVIEDDEAVDTYRTNSVWAQNFSEHWARHVIPSCGPWSFAGMSDRQISFTRNPKHYEPLRVLVEKIETQFKESPDSVWQDFKAGKIDSYALRPDQLIELEEFMLSDQYRSQSRNGLAIKRLEYVGRVYSYLGWNQAKPFFASKKIRQAMTHAIDRNRIIQQNLNGMGIEITGPFYRYSSSYDQTIDVYPFDPALARRLLEEDGWYDSDGDGIVDKLIDGKRVPFRFSLTYYVKNPTAKAVADYVSTALKEIGVACELNGMDIADLSSSFEDKNFDSILMGWSLGTPPENPKQLWHSLGAKQKGSSNAVGFANAEADQIIERLEYEYDPVERKRLYHRFHQIIHEEAPYTFLYTPKSVLLYREYVQNVFIPAERQDLVPGADQGTPSDDVFWLKKKAV